MTISREELQNLYSMARDHWINAEAHRYAYRRAYDKAITLSERLQWITIGTAVATSLLGGIGTNRWITAIVGAVTAAVAAANKGLDPAGKSQKYWTTIKQLDNFKGDMVTTAVTLSRSENVMTGTEPFKQFGTRMESILGQPVSLDDEDRVQARKEFADSTIAMLIARLEEPAPEAASFGVTDGGAGDGTDVEIDVADEGMAEDAPGIVAPVRARAS